MTESQKETLRAALDTFEGACKDEIEEKGGIEGEVNAVTEDKLHLSNITELRIALGL